MCDPGATAAHWRHRGAPAQSRRSVPLRRTGATTAHRRNPDAQCHCGAPAPQRHGSAPAQYNQSVPMQHTTVTKVHPGALGGSWVALLRLGDTNMLQCTEWLDGASTPWWRRCAALAPVCRGGAPRWRCCAAVVPVRRGGAGAPQWHCVSGLRRCATVAPVRLSGDHSKILTIIAAE